MRRRSSHRFAIVLWAAATAFLGATGLYAWIFWRAERLADVVDLQIFALYDCVALGVEKGAQRYVSPDGRLESSGVPNASITLFDESGKQLIKAKSDRRGEFPLFPNDRADDPLARIARVAVFSSRFPAVSLPVKLDSIHRFFGESIAERGYRYEARLRLFCEPGKGERASGVSTGGSVVAQPSPKSRNN